MAGSRNPRIPEWSSGGRRDSNRSRPATGRLPRRTTGALNPASVEQPVHSSFIPDEFKTEEDLPFVPNSGPGTGGGKPATGNVATEVNLPIHQDPEAIDAADAGPGQVQLFAEKYELLEKVGEGGMGSVYKAHNRLLNVDVALKVLTPEKITSPDVRERFLREARATQMFRHRHAIAVQEVGELSDGTVYLTMDFSSGENLDARIKRLGRLSLDEAILITLQVLDALAEAHRTGIVHRDLKPGNIMVELSGGRPSAMVVDFGIAKILQDTGIMSRQGAPLTSPGLILGTVEYMSPEQAGGAVIDARSDIYSMGAVLYHMLTGQLPSPSDAVQNMIINIMFQPPKPIREIISDGTIPPEVEAVVMKALAKSVEERYQSAHEFGEALRVASADYLPDDTRTQSSSFRLPSHNQQAFDPNTAPTMHLLPPLDSPAPAVPAGGSLRMGAAQKWLAGVAVVLLLSVIGLAAWKKMRQPTGLADTARLTEYSTLESAADWEKLGTLTAETLVDDPADLPALRFNAIAKMELALLHARTLGSKDPEAYLAHLNNAEKQLLDQLPIDPDVAPVVTRYAEPLTATRAGLQAWQQMPMAEKAYSDTLYGPALDRLKQAAALFERAAVDPPARLAELQHLATKGLNLLRAADAARMAQAAESANPPDTDTAGTQWLVMLKALRDALQLETIRADGSLTEPAPYRKRTEEYLEATRARCLGMLPAGMVGDLDEESVARLPAQLDRFHEFLTARRQPLELPIGDDPAKTLMQFLPESAFQSLRDECDRKWTARLVSEGDWQFKQCHLDDALPMYTKALSIALPEAVPILRKKIDDTSALQVAIDEMLKAARRAHQDGQELEADALLTRFLLEYPESPRAPEARELQNQIRKIIEKSVGFKVSSSPAGADVYLNAGEKPLGRTPLIVTTDFGLKPDEDNTLELRLQGFEPVVTTRRFTGAGLALIDFTLQPKHGRLIVRVGAPNVAIILTNYNLNDQLAELPWDRRRTNVDGEAVWDEIPVGKWQVDIQPPVGFLPVKKVILIPESPAALFEVALDSAPATLVLRTQPPNLKVKIDGVDLPGRTPMSIDLPAGSVRVLIVGEDGFELPLDFDLLPGDSKRPEIIQFDFETERQKNAWQSLQTVVEDPQSTLTARVNAQLAFLRECGAHARAARVRVDLDDLVPAHLRTLSAPADYLSFVSDYAAVAPRGKYIQQFRSRVNTMLFFPFLAPAAKGYLNGSIVATAANGLEYLLRWGDNGLQIVRPDGVVQTIYAGFSIFNVRTVQGCSDIIWMQERPDDVMGRTRRLSKMIEQTGVMGADAFQKYLNQDHYGEFGLISAPIEGRAWFAPVSKNKLPEVGVFSLEWKSDYEAHILPNGNTLLLSTETLADGRVATVLQLFDPKGDHYLARQLAREVLDPISTRYTVYSVSPEGSMVILHGLNKGEDDYRVVRTTTLNANYYAHVGKVRNIQFGYRGTRLVVHGLQGVEVYEIGGLNSLKRQVAGIFENVQITPDDQYMILARQGDFAIVETSGNAPARSFPDMRVLAIDASCERILAHQDRNLVWVYWRTGETVKITDLDALWKTAHGARADDPPPRLSPTVQARLLNGGHAALFLQDGSVLYFDLTAPRRLSENDVQLLKRVRDQLK